MFAALPVSPGILLAADPAAAGPETPESSFAWMTVMNLVLAPVILVLLARSQGWRPPSRRGHPLATPWRLSPMVGPMLFGLSLILGGLGVMVASRLIPADASNMWRITLTMWGGIGGSLLGCLPAAVIWKNQVRPIHAARPMRPFSGFLAAGLTLLISIPLVQTVSVLGQLIQEWISSETPSNLAHATLRLMVDAPRDPAWWLLAAGAVIGAPVLEEILYRGFIQQSARKVGLGPWPASIITGSLFAIMHLSAIPDENRISALTSLAVLGVALGLLRERAGRLDACILAHSGFNLFNLLLATAVA